MKLEHLKEPEPPQRWWRFDYTILGCIVLTVGAVLGVWYGIGYVVVHFVRKFW